MSSRRSRDAVPFSLFAFQDIITSVTGIVLFITLILTLELVTKKVDSPSQQTAALLPEMELALSEAMAEIESLKADLQTQSVSLESTAGISSQEIERHLYETIAQIARLKAEIERLTQRSQKKSVEQTSWNAKRFERESDRQQLNSLRERIDLLEHEINSLAQSDRIVFNPSDASGVAWIVDLSERRILVAQAGIATTPLTFDSPQKDLRTSAFMHWTKRIDPSQEYFLILIRPGAIDAFDDIYEKLQARHFRIGFDLLSAEQTVIDPQYGAAPRPILP
jgi:Tfp pilus assembly protein PilN